MILVNGKLQNTLEITDRGLHYGDGLFETIEVTRQTPVFLAQHLARLKAGCQVLQIPYPDETLLLDEITQLSKTSELQVQHQPFLKLILPFGTGKHLFQAVIMFQACKQRV
jgi:4-amino-4-deoxychorismate lyase